MISERVKGRKPEDGNPEAEMVTLGVDCLSFRWIAAAMEEAFGFVMQGGGSMNISKC